VNKGTLFIDDRDLCTIWVKTELTNGSILVLQTSVEDSRVPETKCVRADADLLATLVEDTNSGCKVTSISHIDPKGLIPSSFVNKVAGKQHDQYIAIKNRLE
jgi:hypothetical protein